VSVVGQGEESVKERFTLDEAKVVPFLEQEYTLEQVGGGGLRGLLYSSTLPYVLAAGATNAGQS
jgi:hypothetical protein